MTLLSRVAAYDSRARPRLAALARPGGLLRSLALHRVKAPSAAAHVFVLGPPRSGTTLLRSLITAHPDYGGFDGETFFFCKRRLDGLAYGPLDAAAYAAMFERARDKVALFDAIAAFFRRHADCRVFVEKTPEHALHLDDLARWFPASRFVFIHRDGRDGYLSARRNPEFWAKVGPNYPALWRDTMNAFLDRRAGEDRLYGVAYEALCRHPVDEMRRLMRWLGAEWDPAQLEPARYAGHVTAPRPGNERLAHGVFAASVGRWREAEDGAAIREFESIAGAALRRAGYAPSNP
jgi:hypothetical protein